MWVLRNGLGSSTRPASGLNYGVMSPGLTLHFLNVAMYSSSKLNVHLFYNLVTSKSTAIYWKMLYFYLKQFLISKLMEAIKH